MNGPRRVAMLGGTGFVGRALVARLLAAGHVVRVVSRNRQRHAERWLAPGATIVECDEYDPAALARAITGCDVAINLVGILNSPGLGDTRKGFERAHVQLTCNLIAACATTGIARLVQMSALNAGRGHSHYLRTRGVAEDTVKASGLAWTILQPSVIFGPGDGLFCRFAGLLRWTPVLPLARAGAKFAPVYVGDVASAFACVLRDERTARQTYELYGPEVLSLAQLVHATAQAMGRRRLVLPLPDALGRLQALAMDFVPGKPFSSDNYRSLRTDAVGGIDGLHRLGIDPVRIAAILPTLFDSAADHAARLDRYRARC